MVGCVVCLGGTHRQLLVDSQLLEVAARLLLAGDGLPVGETDRAGPTPHQPLETGQVGTDMEHPFGLVPTRNALLFLVSHPKYTLVPVDSHLSEQPPHAYAPDLPL